jgi:hypothetical protein
LTPDTGKVGTSVVLAIASSGFSLDGPYKVVWSKSPISDAGNYTLVAEGNVAKGSTQVTAIFTIPEAAYGTNYVQFRRGWRPEDNPYNFIFNVLPGIKVTPSLVSVGSEVTIKGTGFPDNNNTVSISLDGKETNLSVSTNDVGSFEAILVIPKTVAGSHEFKATVENMSLGDISASIQIQPSITLDPQHPQVGGEVTMTGSGFAGNSVVSVRFDDIPISDSSPKTDEIGNFTHIFNVPKSSKASHEVIATDKFNNTATYGLALESDAPLAPTAISPREQRFGWFGSQLVTFTWTKVDDPSSVTYTLEISENLNFFPLKPGMRKIGLTETTCGVKVEPGTYYWRVKAVDGAGNEGEWAISPHPFKVGFFSTWFLVIGGLLFLFLFVVLVRAFFRRMREYF